MSDGGRRTVPFAGQVVGVEWSGRRARELAELAFGACPGVDDRLPDTIFRLGSRDDTPLLTLLCGRACLYRGDSPGTAAHLLVQAALDSLIRSSAGGLVLHAAVLGRGDAGLLLPGPTGSGKTMLAAWLTAKGLDHLSDEAGYLPEGGDVVEGFARPFCFRGPWAESLGLGDYDACRLLHNDGVTLVPAELLNAAPRRTTIVPRLVVFPRFRPDAEVELTRHTPARAAIRLLETVANARNLHDLGAGRVAALALTVDAYHLTYGSFRQLDPLMKLIETLA